MSQAVTISNDRLLLAMTSAFGCLLSELQKAGVVDAANVVEQLQSAAAAHRAKGDPERLADALHVFSDFLLTAVPAPAAGRS
ncbi:MAG: hypothetical protein AB7O44_04345 [Hyphomicrobiaceae bacterium]|jgi:hypothetical protein